MDAAEEDWFIVPTAAMLRRMKAETLPLEVPRSSTGKPPSGWRLVIPGLALSAVVAAAATALAQVVPLGSGPVLGIILGLLVGALLGPDQTLRPGLAMSSSKFLRGAVIVLGAELSLGPVLREGIRSLPVILITLGGVLLAARYLGRRLAIPRPLRTLVGVGTGICGASAIAAVSPVIAATELEVGYAVATIFLFNILAVFAFPPLGHALGLGEHAFGVFAGTAVNDLSSVVAAASVYGASSLQTAVVVKLTRTLMIIPICIALANRYGSAQSVAYEQAGAQELGAPPTGFARVRNQMSRGLSLVPTFLFGFILLAAVNTAGLIPHSLEPTLRSTATLMITVALSAVGLSINVSELRRTGVKPIALGAALWVAITVLSLACHAVGLA